MQTSTGADAISTSPSRGCTWRMRLVQVLIILCVCGAQRVWLAQHAVTIAPDGTLQIRMARQWAADPAGAIASSRFHPGYPAAIAWAHAAMVRAGAEDDLGAWESAGRMVSLVFSLIATLLLWGFAGIVFDWRIAWITALLFGLGRKWAALGSDVLTESMVICLQMGAVVLAIAVGDAVGRGSRWALLKAAGAGIAAGAAYLVRPEGLLLVPLMALFWLGGLVRKPKRWKLAACCVVLMVLASAACAGPYMAAIGTATKRHELASLVSGGGAPAPAHVAFFSSATFGPTMRQFGSKLTEASHPAMAILFGLWLSAWIGWRVLRLPLPAGVRVQPRPAGVFWMIAWGAVLLPLLLPRPHWPGRVSHRYLMFQAMLMVPLGGAGMAIVCEWGRLLVIRFRRLEVAGRFCLIAGTAALAVPVGLDSLRPLHRNQAHLRQGGEYLRRVAARPEDVILTLSHLVLHYSQGEGCVLHLEHFRQGRRAVLSYTRQVDATYLAISDAAVKRSDPGLTNLFRPPVYLPLANFTRVSSAAPDVLRIYRVDRKALRKALLPKPSGARSTRPGV